uniref:Immunoglobulin V-set domain-containing protein n=1 Tax=Sinocyclocheilus rhinocerous TaxID=307959 RepID=A0A673MH75_9TELE
RNQQICLWLTTLLNAAQTHDLQSANHNALDSLQNLCPYESGYESNPKYLCKGECKFGSRNIMVKSGSPAKDQRFSLSDDTTARVFTVTVTITDLRTEDEGQYWCAVERTLPDVYSEILFIKNLEDCIWLGLG